MKTLLFFVLFCVSDHAFGQKSSDYTFDYTNENDSIQFSKKGKRSIEKRYYPSGVLKRKKTCFKNVVGSKGYSKTRYKYVEWSEEGKKMNKIRVRAVISDRSARGGIWVLRDDGKVCLKKRRMNKEY